MIKINFYKNLLFLLYSIFFINMDSILVPLLYQTPNIINLLENAAFITIYLVKIIFF